MVGFFNKDDEGNYGTAEKDGSANSEWFFSYRVSFMQNIL